jgi:hypothetical protein
MYATSPFAKAWLNSLDFDTRLASGLSQAHPKYVLYRTEIVAYVTHPHEWRISVAQWGKNLNGVKNWSLNWVWLKYSRLVSVDTNNQA